MYCFSVLVFSLVMIYSVAPRYGRSNPLVYISICSLVGSVSIMAVKGFGIAVKLTIAGNNQFTYLSTYVFGAVVAGCIMVQMNYFNKALDIFSTNVYVHLSSAFLTSPLTPHVVSIPCITSASLPRPSSLLSFSSKDSTPTIPRTPSRSLPASWSPSSASISSSFLASPSRQPPTATLRSKVAS